MAADEVTVLRLRLLELGYSPIPLFGKEPPIYGKNNQRKGLGNWQQLDGVTCKQIEMWSKTWPDATNTGALTLLMPTLDLDILNEAAARAIEDTASTMRSAATSSHGSADCQSARFRFAQRSRSADCRQCRRPERERGEARISGRRAASCHRRNTS
jgi:hypothetical protein